MVHNYGTNMQQFGNLLYLFFSSLQCKGDDTAVKQAVAKYIAKFRFFIQNILLRLYKKPTLLYVHNLGKKSHYCLVFMCIFIKKVNKATVTPESIDGKI